MDKEVWEANKVQCQEADRVKKVWIQTLKVEFESLKMNKNELLHDFFMKLYGLVTNIRALGEAMDESRVVKKLFHAVSQRFFKITSTMEQFGNMDTMSVEEAVFT